MKTLLKLSRILKDTKFEKEYKYEHIILIDNLGDFGEIGKKFGEKGSIPEDWTEDLSEEGAYKIRRFPSYDIANDLLITHAKELFGENPICGECLRDAQACSSDNSDEIKLCEGGMGYSYEIHSHNILSMLQQEKPQEGIEDYIIENLII